MASVTFDSRDSSLAAAAQRTEWQVVLARAVRSPAELCRRLGLDPSLAVEAESAAHDFPLLVPEPYLHRIRPGDPDDPLLRQVLPRAAEQIPSPGFSIDPLGESKKAGGSGLLRKYHGRILMVTTGACGVHCRFCFRRHFPYRRSSLPGRPISDAHAEEVWKTALAEVAADQSIDEVILSGGDPLTLPDAALARLARQLDQIPHLRRLRIHTRLPVMIPQRVNDDLLGWLRGGRLKPFVVVHVNHPAEIDGEVADAFGRLIDAGVSVLSQSVLLCGINDQPDVLAKLFRQLVDLQVIPYYLHHLDPVAGVAHFEVPIERGVALMTELRARLPGYAVPRYVRETPDGVSKEVLA